MKSYAARRATKARKEMLITTIAFIAIIAFAAPVAYFVGDAMQQQSIQNK